tara:strand:- start:187 stop:381 length:195 start_codon:yes stop_codon:yes gene_type:complete
VGTFVAWPALLVRIGASAPPSFLKMDVEGFEYDVLGTMLESAEARPINRVPNPAACKISKMVTE